MFTKIEQLKLNEYRPLTSEEVIRLREEMDTWEKNY